MPHFKSSPTPWHRYICLYIWRRHLYILTAQAASSASLRHPENGKVNAYVVDRECILYTAITNTTITTRTSTTRRSIRMIGSEALLIFQKYTWLGLWTLPSPRTHKTNNHNKRGQCCIRTLALPYPTNPSPLIYTISLSRQLLAFDPFVTRGPIERTALVVVVVVAAPAAFIPLAAALT